MSITGAITLGHLATTSQNPMSKFILMNLLRNSRLLDSFPIMPVEALNNVAVKVTSLPSPAFRQMNAGYTRSVGDTAQVWESVYPIGGEFAVDRILKKVKNVIKDPVMVQTELHLEALALTVNDYLINGDQTTDPNGFEGLKKRVAGMPSRQSVYFAGSSSAALDPTASAANARAFFDAFDKAYRYANGGANMIIANEGMILGLARVLRYAQISGGNFLDVTRDVFGREIDTFRGTPVVDAGLKVDQTTEIITETETAGDAGADATSTYFINFDDRKGVVGIQLGGLEFYDPLTGGEMEGTPTGLVRYEWPLGLYSPGSYGIVRAQNVEGAASWT